MAAYGSALTFAPEAHMKKDSYPLPRIQEVLESLVGAGHFFCLDLKSGFWQIKIEGGIETVHCLSHAGDIPTAYAELPGQVKPHLLPDLPR